MVIIFDKNVDANITSVESGDVIGEIFYWQSETAHGWTIDRTNFKIRMGADDATINFANSEGMQPYIDQFIAMSSMYNPAVDGVNTDPFYDKPKTGQIEEHTYVDTDIEQEWKDGER